MEIIVCEPFLLSEWQHFIGKSKDANNENLGFAFEIAVNYLLNMSYDDRSDIIIVPILLKIFRRFDEPLNFDYLHQQVINIIYNVRNEYLRLYSLGFWNDHNLYLEAEWCSSYAESYIL